MEAPKKMPNSEFVSHKRSVNFNLGDHKIATRKFIQSIR